MSEFGALQDPGVRDLVAHRGKVKPRAVSNHPDILPVEIGEAPKCAARYERRSG